MAQVVYSTHFWSAHIAGGGDDELYVVPTGKLAILRDMDVIMVGNPGDVIEVYDGATGDDFFYLINPPTSTWFPWRGRQVFAAGASIRWDASGAAGTTAYCRASGYLLDN